MWTHMTTWCKIGWKESNSSEAAASHKSSVFDDPHVVSQWGPDNQGLGINEILVQSVAICHDQASSMGYHFLDKLHLEMVEKGAPTMAAPHPTIPPPKNKKQQSWDSTKKASVSSSSPKSRVWPKSKDLDLGGCSLSTMLSGRWLPTQSWPFSIPACSSELRHYWYTMRRLSLAPWSTFISPVVLMDGIDKNIPRPRALIL